MFNHFISFTSPKGEREILSLPFERDGRGKKKLGWNVIAGMKKEAGLKYFTLGRRWVEIIEDRFEVEQKRNIYFP